MESNKIAGTTVVAAIVPGTTADIYPTHLAEYGKGGWRSVSSFDELSKIKSGRIENGMVAYVLDQNKPYIYLNGWEELELGTKIQGIFAFKGVAEAINPDQRILTIKSLETQEITGKDGKVTPSETLYCITTAYEFDMDVYYGWGTSLNDIRFWTDTPTVNSTTPQYGKGEEMAVTAYEFDGELYYPIDSTVAPTAGDPVIPYENVNGRIIYISEYDEVYDNADAAGGSIGKATQITYMGCDFSVRQSIALEENTTSETITASLDNSGHVYQIGENEYASNGTIWVKLGSPVEDWIIL